MNKICLAVVVFVVAHGSAFAQNDTQRLESAREALEKHNCADASKTLSQMSPASRQGAPYLLNMAKTQDCMNNTAQAIYYYNKYLALQPADDTVTRRVAELTDKKNNTVKSGENGVNVNTYKPASRKRKKNRRELVDNYYYSGLAYSMGLGANAPLRSGFGADGGDGFTIMKERAVLDLNSTVLYMFTPGSTWENNANQTLGSGAVSAGSGWAISLTFGFSPVLINKRDLALTAGVFGGLDLCYVSSDVATSMDLKPKLSPCYGIKSNLFLGEHVIFFGRLLLTTANTITATDNYSGDYSVPTSYARADLGIALRVDSWW